MNRVYTIQKFARFRGIGYVFIRDIFGITMRAISCKQLQTKYSPYLMSATKIFMETLFSQISPTVYFQHETLSGNLICDITDHFPNFLILNKFACASPNPRIYRRDYSNFNEEMLLEEMGQVN